MHQVIKTLEYDFELDLFQNSYLVWDRMLLKSNSLLKSALLRIVSEKLSFIALSVVGIYFFIAFLVSIGAIASGPEFLVFLLVWFQRKYQNYPDQ